MGAFTNPQLTIFESTTDSTMATKKEASKKKSTHKFVGTLKQFASQAKEITDDPTAKIFMGVMLLFISAFIFFAEISFLWNWTEDFSLNTADDTALQSLTASNLLGTLGHRIGWLLMLRGFGIGGFLFAFYLFAMGLRIAFEFKRFKPIGLFNHTIILVSILSIFISALVPSHPTVLGGITGFYFSNYMGIKLGSMGIYLVLLGITALYLIVTFKISKLNVPSRKLAKKDIESGDESSQIDVE